MLDETISKWAKWIQDSVIPQFSYLVDSIRNFHPLENLSPEELQYKCIKIAIYAILCAILFKIGNQMNKWRRRKHREKEKSTKFPKSNSIKWSQTGWYWDDKKGLWVPPDYLKDESHEKWKWDDEKKIWIDANKEIEEDKETPPKTNP